MEKLKRTILITGGAGFIGSELVRQLIQETEFCVINIDKLTYAGNLASLKIIEEHPRYHFEKLDIIDSLKIKKLFETYKPSAVIHLAAESHVDRSIDGPQAFIQTNILGTFTLLQESLHYWKSLDEKNRQIFRFHHVSTDEVFGSLGNEGKFTENSPYQPHSPYSASKASSDHLVRAWFHTYGLPVLITNCSNNYGPYQFPEKLIPLMIIKAMEGSPLPVYGNGQNIRDWLYVKDHANALRLVLEKGKIGETYNIGGDSEQTNLQIVEFICDNLDKILPPLSSPAESRRKLIRFVSDRPGHDMRYSIDCSKIKTELGWKAQENLESGLNKTIQWYLENQGFWKAILKNNYQGERLGLKGTP